jgi:hypothetical protein
MAPSGAAGGGNGDQVAEDRKLVHTSALDMIVKSPAQTSEKIVQQVQAAGGFLLSPQVNGGADASERHPRHSGAGGEIRRGPRSRR